MWRGSLARGRFRLVISPEGVGPQRIGDATRRPGRAGGTNRQTGSDLGPTALSAGYRGSAGRCRGRSTERRSGQLERVPARMPLEEQAGFVLAMLVDEGGALHRADV